MRRKRDEEERNIRKERDEKNNKRWAELRANFKKLQDAHNAKKAWYFGGMDKKDRGEDARREGHQRE